MTSWKRYQLRFGGLWEAEFAREDEFNLDVLSFRWLLDIPVELLPRQLQCAGLELEGRLGRRQRFGSRCWDNI